MDRPLLEFPCSFPIKVMGREDPGFRDFAVALIEKHAGSIDDDAVRCATSRNGRFTSVTVTIDATSQRQLDAIYRDLTGSKRILVAL